LLDAMRVHFHGKDWTLYLMAFKPLGSGYAYFTDPFLLPERESIRFWMEAWQAIPAMCRRSVVALICDDLSGMVAWGQRQGWAVQLCQFHVLQHLYLYRGTRLGPPELQERRQRVFHLVRQALREPDSLRIPGLVQEIKVLSRSITRSKFYSWILSRFIKRLPLYRTWQQFPHLDLPATTSPMESKIRCLRDLMRRARNLRSPKAFHAWTTAYLRLYPTIKWQSKIISTKLFC
jgi:hypothetical protein